MQNKIKSSPQVDILIISFNQDKFIGNAIQSAIDQNYPNIKIIVSDDCSTDSTQKIINDWHKNYPDKIIPVFNKKNLGITGNSNIGLSYCKGDFFVFMGGDDVLYPDKVAKQIKWFTENSDAFLCGHKLDLINESSQQIGTYRNSNCSTGKGPDAWFKYGMLFGCMSIMIKTASDGKAIHKPSFDERMPYSSDLKFFIDFIKPNLKYGFINEPLGAYRKHDNSITASKWEQCIEDSALLFDIAEKEQNCKLHKKSIAFGRNYLLVYGRALRNMNEKKYTLAIKIFFLAIKNNPFLWKAYYRLFETLFLLIKTIAKK
jgi:glycosyltransferase involved in cell wall biosynthesis